MKKLTIVPIIIPLVIFIMSCGLVPEPYTTTHCYLESGIKLVYGTDTDQWREVYQRDKHLWEPVGYVSEVFNHYNTDDELEMFYEYVEGNSNRDEVEDWLNKGYRVVILYELPPNNHSVYITSVEQCDGKNILWAFVAGYFNKEV